jgi:c-di-GMP-related signal transduction protein
VFLFINLAYLGLKRRISSIKQALPLLGIAEVKKWMMLMLLSKIVQDEPEELAVNATVRKAMGMASPATLPDCASRKWR